MGTEAGLHNQQNTGSHAALSRGRCVLGIADNLKRFGATVPALLLALQFKLSLAPYWPISILPVGQSMPEAAAFF